jgi:hypothetical protein
VSTTNKDLAKRAREIGRSSEGLRRVAANCCFVALSYSPSLDVARSALQELERPDTRRAALALLDELAAAETAV